MVDYYTILGMVLACFIAIIGIYFSIKSNAQKEKEPINELNLNIVKKYYFIDKLMLITEKSLECSAFRQPHSKLCNIFAYPLSFSILSFSEAILVSASFFFFFSSSTTCSGA